MPPVIFISETLKNVCMDSGRIQQLIIALANRDFSHGSHVERLATKHLVLSIRLNKKERILFTYKENMKNEKGDYIPIILEFDANHDYDSKFLNEKVFKSFFEKNFANFDEKLLHPSSEPPTEMQNIAPEVRFIMGENLIKLDQNQSNISIPAIVEGPPGSGKTCLAYITLEKSAQDPSLNRILYVTHSSFLSNKIRSQWEEKGEIESQNRVTIKSYQELLKEIYPGLNPRSCPKQQSVDFILKNLTQSEHQFSKKTIEYHAERIFQEFRLLSGFEDPEKYIESGSKISDFSQDRRKETVALYQGWMTHFNVQQFSDFLPFPQEATPYDLILVDEAQDFSCIQLKNLMRLAQSNIVYFLDSKQNLLDVDQKTLYLKSEFKHLNNNRELKVLSLKSSYRCPPAVMKMAKELNDIRLDLTPSMRQTADIQIQEDTEKRGSVQWIDNDENYRVIFREAKNDINTFIICDFENQQKLMAEGYSRVFTPEQVKGLESKNIILHFPLSHPIFRRINEELKKHHDSISIDHQLNLTFSPYLCALFTSITRAQDSLIIFQPKQETLDTIVSQLKKHETTRPKQSASSSSSSSSSGSKCIDIQASIKQAQYLYGQGAELQARAILLQEVFPGEPDKVDPFIQTWNKAPQSPEITLNKQEDDQKTKVYTKKDYDKAIKLFLSHQAKLSDLEVFTTKTMIPELVRHIEKNYNVKIFLEAFANFLLKEKREESFVLSFSRYACVLYPESLYSLSLLMGESPNYKNTSVPAGFLQQAASAGDIQANLFLSYRHMENFDKETTSDKKFETLTKAIDYAQRSLPISKDQYHKSLHALRGYASLYIRDKKDMIAQAESIIQAMILISNQKNHSQQTLRLFKECLLKHEIHFPLSQDHQLLHTFINGLFVLFSHFFKKRESEIPFEIISFLSLYYPEYNWEIRKLLRTISDKKDRELIFHLDSSSGKAGVVDAKKDYLSPDSNILSDLDFSSPKAFSQSMYRLTIGIDFTLDLGPQYADLRNKMVAMMWQEVLCQFHTTDKILSLRKQEIYSSFLMRYLMTCTDVTFMLSPIQLISSRNQSFPWNDFHADLKLNPLFFLAQKRPKGFELVLSKLIDCELIDLTARDADGRSILVFMFMLKFERELVHKILIALGPEVYELMKGEDPKFHTLIENGLAQFTVQTSAPSSASSSTNKLKT